jgi:hypothetical protein
MEILESIAYIVVGFVPTLALLELSYRLGKKVPGLRRRSANVVVRSETPEHHQQHSRVSYPLLIKAMRGDVR